MERGHLRSFLVLLIVSGVAAGGATPDPPPPREFALVFSVGYGTKDHMPKDPAGFEKLLANLEDAGYNAIHCVYKDWRLPLCRKHGVRMMIDVLAHGDDARTDIRRDDQRENVKAICLKVRGDDGVWGYNLWNERLDYFGKPVAQRLNRFLAMLREWDPTHPVWVGTYRNYFPDRVQPNPGVHGYYDYHWARGMGYHFANLHWYFSFLQKRNAYLGRWILVHDYNRNMYTLNTSIAFGLKVAIWFIGGPWDARTGKWNPNHHFIRIGRRMRKLFPELGKIGKPLAVYSTPTSRTPDNRDKPPGVPRPLQPFPEDHWLAVKQGEAVAGFFEHPDGSDAVYFANHNAFAWQGMVVELREPKPEKIKAWQFDKEAGEWVEFRPARLISFPLAPGDGELFKFKRPR